VEAPAAVEEDRLESNDVVEATDELLDEIDSVLEDQAVLVHYRQKSGQ
jgi:Pup-like protein.